MFPRAPHDDQVDATSQALAHKGRSWGWDDNSLKGLNMFYGAFFLKIDIASGDEVEGCSQSARP